MDPIPDDSVASAGTALRWLRTAAEAGRRMRTGDGAIIYGLWTRACALIVNLVTILLLARFLSLQAQGYFYTFRSFLALQVFFELGLTTALSAFFSHEFAHLRWNPSGEIVGPTGPRSRCLDIYRQAVALFRWLSVGFVISVTPLGYWFFVGKQQVGVHWVIPWIVAVLATGWFLYFTPHLALIMGSGEVAAVYKVWLAGGILGGLLAWALLVAGHGLYAVMAVNLGNATCAFLYLWWRKRWLLVFREPHAASTFSWRRELWPMQWRMALSWMSGYFVYPVFTPILFQYHGAAPAGRMGMTLNASTALLGVCLVIINVEMPAMGKLIAQRRWQDLDRLYRATVVIAVCIALAGTVVGCLVLQLLQAYHWNLGARFLPWWIAGMVLLSTTNTAFVNAAANYLRAHKCEPLMWQSIVMALLQGAVTWWAGAYYGAIGEAAGFLLTSGAVAFPLIYFSHRYYRRAWHGVGLFADQELPG